MANSKAFSGFSVSDEELANHIKKQKEKSVVNNTVRGSEVSFFQAMVSDEANYIKKGIVKQSDLLHAVAVEGE